MAWLNRTEERWAHALISAMIPPGSPSLAAGGGPALPGAGQLDLSPFWPTFFARSPWHLRLGLHLAVLLLTLLPLLLGPRRRLFTGLDDDARDAFLGRVAGSRLYLLRQLVLVIKLCACLAFFRDPSVRRQFPGLGP